MSYPKVDVTAEPGSGGPKSVPPQPAFPALERAVLAGWEADRTFQASVEARPAGENGAHEFVFYDGPPFANGLPHYGHLLTGYVKDVVPRYQTHARPPRGAPVRLGHPRPAGTRWRPSTSWASSTSRI